MTTQDKLITVRQAARQCGRNMETVRRWIWAGKLPAQKLGNQLFIKKSALDNYCRETAMKPYHVEKKEDFLERAIRLQDRIRARGGKPIDAAEEIRRMREERMKQIEESLR